MIYYCFTFLKKLNCLDITNNIYMYCFERPLPANQLFIAVNLCRILSYILTRAWFRVKFKIMIENKAVGFEG